MELYVNELGIKIAVPYPEKKGYARIIFIPKEGAIEDKLLYVTQEEKDFQLIKFVADGSLMAAVTHNGKMIKVIDV